jgi:hypothetical protein
MEVSLSPPLISKKSYQNDFFFMKQKNVAGSLIPNKALGLP